MWEPWYWLSWDAMLWWHFDHFKTHQNPPDTPTVWMQACWRLPGLDLFHLSTDLGHLPNRESLVALTVKTPPVMQETWVQFLGQEDPLEKEMATHSSILAWRIPRKEETGRLQSVGSQRVRHNWVTNTYTRTGGRGGSAGEEERRGKQLRGVGTIQRGYFGRSYFITHFFAQRRNIKLQGRFKLDRSHSSDKNRNKNK